MSSEIETLLIEQLESLSGRHSAEVEQLAELVKQLADQQSTDVKQLTDHIERLAQQSQLQRKSALLEDVRHQGMEQQQQEMKQQVEKLTSQVVKLMTLCKAQNERIEQLAKLMPQQRR